MERRLGLAFTTLTIFAPLAQASHPQQAVRAEGTAKPLEFVATPTSPRGVAFARQVLPVRADRATAQRAVSRVIYLNRDGAIVRPGDNDARIQRSSIVGEPTAIAGWDVDDDTWTETVACVAEMYAAFDVRITDEDPGDVPHIAALLGGHPNDVGLPDNVAGVSPFTEDCAIIDNAIVYGFTDVMPDDPQFVCEVVAQEIAHSFGLDHEMLPSDPMTYLDYDCPRAFEDELAMCGEYEGRPCGINGSICRQRQSSVALLRQRLGAAPRADDDEPSRPDDSLQHAAGCSASRGSAGIAMALAMLVLRRRRR